MVRTSTRASSPARRIATAVAGTTVGRVRPWLGIDFTGLDLFDEIDQDAIG